VHAANAAVTKMAAAGDSFRLAGSRLSFKSPEHQRSLERFLAGPGIEGALALKVERAEKQPPYRVLISALAQPGDTAPSHPLFTAFVYQPHAGRHIPLSVLRELYGLTAAEARLVIRLVQWGKHRDRSECYRDIDQHCALTLEAHLREM
jgi:hypothetical protein